MNTDARRKASAEFLAKRKAAGWRKVTTWLSPEAAFKLDAIKAAAGSADQAINSALLAYTGPGEARPVEAPPPAAKARALERAAPPKPPTSEHKVQIGPSNPKPGALLIDKRKKR